MFENLAQIVSSVTNSASKAPPPDSESATHTDVTNIFADIVGHSQKTQVGFNQRRPSKETFNLNQLTNKAHSIT